MALGLPVLPVLLGLLGPGVPDPEPCAGLQRETTAWQARFETEVSRRLPLPPPGPQRARYAQQVDEALAEVTGPLDPIELVLVVDRSPRVQTVFLLLKSVGCGWFWLGAAPVSTGRVGSFDHFLTPVGAFLHSPDHPDFRAEGSFNSQHIRGYGRRGMRVYDFGWVLAERGWGAGGRSLMRLQMHATDPARLEPLLGRPASKGCIRIPASLNTFIDHHGVLDRAYLEAQAAGRPQWILQAQREPVPWPGRFLVVVDSAAP